MKLALPLVGLSAIYLLSQRVKPNSLKSSKLKPVEDDEDLPDNINTKINEENIFKYYSKSPILIKSIPFIFDDLNDDLKVYYDPQSEFGNEKSYVFINSDLAKQVWGYAKTLLGNYPKEYSGKTNKEADVVTKAILLKFAPDVYWKEGLTPYIYQSAFWYVWASTTFLVRIAYADLNNLNQNFVPALIG